MSDLVNLLKICIDQALILGIIFSQSSEIWGNLNDLVEVVLACPRACAVYPARVTSFWKTSNLNEA